MITYKRLEEDFNKKCPHKKLTPWAEIYWALGHGTGTSERCCKRCGARVYYNYVCKICNKCGEKNSWYLSFCLKCKSEDLTEYNIIEKLGKIIKKRRIKNERRNRFQKG